jgi:hypothetical protein
MGRSRTCCSERCRDAAARRAAADSADSAGASEDRRAMLPEPPRPVDAYDLEGASVGLLAEEMEAEEEADEAEEALFVRTAASGARAKPVGGSASRGGFAGCLSTWVRLPAPPRPAKRLSVGYAVEVR